MRKQSVLICPHCQAENAHDYLTCSTCEESLILTLGPEPAPPPGVPKRTFRLDSLMLVVALAAVCFGITREMPDLGIPILLLVGPAMVRTLQNIHERRAVGHPMPFSQRIEAFFASLAIIALIGLSAGGVLSLACFGGMLVGLIGEACLVGMPDSHDVLFVPTGASLGTAVGMMVGIPTAIVVGVRVGRRFWRFKG